VRDLAHSDDDQAIALAVISLGHRLNLRVIAEGVETEEQRKFLAANECDEMQGYLFSPPVPAERITEMLQAQFSTQMLDHTPSDGSRPRLTGLA
jgi:EAL domain-containing protein (putative c-di-GMP-specific phosphodiesterase class I)